MRWSPRKNDGAGRWRWDLHVARVTGGRRCAGYVLCAGRYWFMAYVGGARVGVRRSLSGAKKLVMGRVAALLVEEAMMRGDPTDVEDTET